jgi:hypothetical protein
VAAMNSSAREEGGVYIPETSLAVAFSNCSQAVVIIQPPVQILHLHWRLSHLHWRLSYDDNRQCKCNICTDGWIMTTAYENRFSHAVTKSWPTYFFTRPTLK